MRNIDRTRRGKGSVHLSRASSTRWDLMCNSCKSNILRQSAPSRCICNRCRRLGCGCASRGSGCAMSTEFHNPRSLCRGCSCRKTRIRAHHRRNHHQRRSCRCLSTVPPCRSGGGGTEGLHVSWPPACCPHFEVFSGGGGVLGFLVNSETGHSEDQQPNLRHALGSLLTVKQAFFKMLIHVSSTAVKTI